MTLRPVVRIHPPRLMAYSSVVEHLTVNQDVAGSIPAMPVLGKRQRLAVLRRTVNPFPSGKHWRFNSSLPHGVGSLPTQRVGNWRMPYNKKIAISVVLCQHLKCRHTAYGNAYWDVAQLARAAVLYTACHGFKSHHPNFTQSLKNTIRQVRGG